MIFFRFIVVFLFVSIQYSCFSQRFRQFSYVDGFSVTPKIGMGFVVGELGDFSTLKPIYGFSVEKGLSEKVNFNLSFSGGELAGEDGVTYNSKFKTDFFQVSLQSVLNISRLFSDGYQSSNIDFRGYLGVGWVWFHANVFDAKSGVFLRTTSDGTTRHTALFQQTGVGVGEQGIYYTRELLIPFGIRLDGKLSKRVGFCVDLGYNYVYNDKFDGTTAYNLGNPNIIGGEYSYSDTMNDGWMNFSLGLRYKFISQWYENKR
jgi:hypothetical protein